MPLFATLNDKIIYGFSFNDQTWKDLQDEPVKMSCCGTKAILKKSHRDTRFFAHHTRGDCTYVGESHEHMYVKSLIAKAALHLGWHVELEQLGQTPDGEEWIADVYCTKENTILVWEVQFSEQTNDEFRRRQSKYRASHIEAIWLLKLKDKQEYYLHDLLSREMPVFGMKSKTGKLEDLYIPEFDEPLETFIKGVFQNQLVRKPQIRDYLNVGIIAHYQNCRVCKERTGMVIALTVQDKYRQEIHSKLFTDQGIPEYLLTSKLFEHLAKLHIGGIRSRFSEVEQQRCLSNGCFHCDTIIERSTIQEVLTHYEHALPDPVHEFGHIFKGSFLGMKNDWHFNEKPTRYFF